MDVALLRLPARRGDEIPADAVADAAAARVQHHPQVSAPVEAQLDEVIAAAQRPHLPHPLFLVVALHLGDSRMLANDFRKAPREGRAGFATRAGLAVLVEPHGDRALDRDARAREAVGKLLGVERKPHGGHSTTDIDSNGRGDDRASRGNHRAHGRADSRVHVGHRRDVAEHDRKLGDVRELRSGMRLDVLGEDLDRNAAAFDDLSDGHIGEANAHVAN